MTSSRLRRLARELTSKPDPQGYYVLPLRPGRLPPQTLEQLARAAGAEVEWAGDVALVRVKGRGAAIRLLENLVKKGARPAA